MGNLNLYRKTQVKDEAKKAWDWLRRFPPYLKSYKDAKKGVKNTQCYIWGFEPLVNPKNKTCEELHDYFLNFVKQDLENPVVPITQWIQILCSNEKEKRKGKQAYIRKAHLDSLRKLINSPTDDGLPGRLIVAIDYTQSHAIIRKKVGEALTNFKQLYSTTAIRPNVQELHLHYKVAVMKRLRMETKKIIKELHLKVVTEGTREATRKQLGRIFENNLMFNYEKNFFEPMEKMVFLTPDKVNKKTGSASLKPFPLF